MIRQSELTFTTGKLFRQGGLALTVAIASLALAAGGAEAKRKHVKEAIAAGIVGIAVGAALSAKHKHRKDIYYPDYRPRYPDGDYNAYYGRSFSPAGGVICYNAQRICYDADGTISHRFTFRLFGR